MAARRIDDLDREIPASPGEVPAEPSPGDLTAATPDARISLDRLRDGDPLDREGEPGPAASGPTLITAYGIDGRLTTLGPPSADPVITRPPRPSMPSEGSLPPLSGRLTLEPPGPGHTPPVTPLDQQRQLERTELANDVITMRRMSVLALTAWLAFGAIDFVVATVIGSGSLLFFWTVRALGTLPVAFVVFRLRGPGMPTRTAFTLLDLAAFCSASACVSAMCIEYGGISSPYLGGVMLIVVARGAILGSHWRRGVLLIAVPALVAPLVLLGAALFSDGIRAQLADPREVAVFGQYMTLLASAVVFMLWGSHVNWSLRRQVYEARSIGRYRLERRLAKGGMAEVWVAYDSGLKRNVALKILRHQIEQGPDAVRRFEHEVSATSQLAHPNTVRVFDYGVTDDGIWYYAMELLEGPNLAELVATEGRLGPERALYIAHQAARALAEAHTRGIYHRDVKPENIIITRAGSEKDFVKVLDFGIAKLTRAEDSLTNTGTLVGTPAFISPEVVCGSQADARSDVYGLGAVIYYMLAGRPPFQGENAAQILQAHVGQTALPLHFVAGPHVPEEVEALVERCLAKDPAQRFVDAGELAEAIRKSAKRQSFSLPVSLMPPAPEQEPQRPDELRNLRSRAPFGSDPESGER